jgi:hypothetical protein
VHSTTLTRARAVFITAKSQEIGQRLYPCYCEHIDFGRGNITWPNLDRSCIRQAIPRSEQRKLSIDQGHFCTLDAFQFVIRLGDDSRLGENPRVRTAIGEHLRELLDVGRYRGICVDAHREAVSQCIAAHAGFAHRGRGPAALLCVASVCGTPPIGTHGVQGRDSCYRLANRYLLTG